MTTRSLASLLREIHEQSPTLKEGSGSAGEISEESE